MISRRLFLNNDILIMISTFWLLDQLAPVPLLSMVMKLLGKIQGVVRLASLCHMACGLLLLPPVRSGDLLPYTAILGSPGFPTTGDSATRFARTSGSIGGFRTIS